MSKGTDYQLLAAQLRALAEGETARLPILANASALIMEALPDVSWAGFYLDDGAGELVLGPFQGKVACMRIAWGRGVCGTAAQEDATQLVPNVHEFAGHIACDSASNSEVVIPIHENGEVMGVLDLDSTSLVRFDEDDAAGLELFVGALEELLPNLR
ncbi:MAG: GAF domain-containing protein [Atopobiaceae bacterium]|nr:GAF domain-containing protein [Atopobiaceae bacterium]